MLGVFISYICALSIAALGYYAIKKIINKEHKLNIKTILYLLIDACIITVIRSISTETAFIYNFILNIVIYMLIFKLRVEESFLATGVTVLLIAVTNIILVPVIIYFTPINELRGNALVYLISTIFVILIMVCLLNVKSISKLLSNIYMILYDNSNDLNMIFMFVGLAGISTAAYNLFCRYKVDIVLISNIVIIIMIIILTLLYVRNIDNYSKLSKEYDNLFNYIQNFEEWIEKEQFIRHEYKNQLAVIYSLATAKGVKQKIKEILDNSIKIEGELINSLKALPKGGLKGLIYYKTSIAQNNKIDIEINVSIKEKGILHKLSKTKFNELSKIIGIYFDNAIEAAMETKPKRMLVEIYELKDCVNIVISNTFQQQSMVKNMGNKGATTKGKGRGNGLYFARKIINQNEWLKEKHEIIDKYYIQTLTVLKSTSKK